MSAAVITAATAWELRDGRPLRPGLGQVRVAIEGCGVCGSDLPVWTGRPWFRYPREPGSPGHEGWGRIDAIGAGVSGLIEGQRVTGLGYHAYASHDVVDAEGLVSLPPQLDREPFPGEALGCAMNVFARSRIRSTDIVAVVGIGFLGAVVAQLAVRSGARVLAISRRPFALQMARRMGCRDTIVLAADAVERVAELTAGRLCDVVIEAAGTQATLDAATPLVRERGRLVIAGFHQDGPRSVDMQLWNWQGIDVINAHEREPAVYVRGIRDAVAAVAAGRLDPAPLYTHRFGLGQLGEALETARRRPDGFMKALVAP